LSSSKGGFLDTPPPSVLILHYAVKIAKIEKSRTKDEGGTPAVPFVLAFLSLPKQ
jgi:hypothetical protein